MEADFHKTLNSAGAVRITIEIVYALGSLILALNGIVYSYYYYFAF